MRQFSGAKLKAAREAAELSQRRLCYTLDVSTATVHRWELGHTNPAQWRWSQIAEILGVEIEDLTEEVPNE
ncbi:helix-turn-helix transcriptional regulator [Streptosporangium sp. NPDC020145]|uniref:helix-turn-helix transcriptional regulator n=1 Tax=Streptosporangium sp. NPDC020145 TaxID=3154694 RepID=UPI00343986F9